MPAVWAEADTVTLTDPAGTAEGWYLTIGDRCYDVDHQKGSDRCGFRDVSSFCFCPLWPGHDGPHIRMSDQLDRHIGPGFAITGMRTRA